MREMKLKQAAKEIALHGTLHGTEDVNGTTIIRNVVHALVKEPLLWGPLYQYKGNEVSVCKSQDSSFKLCKRNTAAEMQQLKSGMCGNSTASQSELKTALKTAYQQLGYCNSTT